MQYTFITPFKCKTHLYLFSIGSRLWFGKNKVFNFKIIKSPCYDFILISLTGNSLLKSAFSIANLKISVMQTLWKIKSVV